MSWRTSVRRSRFSTMSRTRSMSAGNSTRLAPSTYFTSCSSRVIGLQREPRKSRHLPCGTHPSFGVTMVLALRSIAGLCRSRTLVSASSTAGVKWVASLNKSIPTGLVISGMTAQYSKLHLPSRPLVGLAATRIQKHGSAQSRHLVQRELVRIPQVGHDVEHRLHANLRRIALAVEAGSGFFVQLPKKGYCGD